MFSTLGCFQVWMGQSAEQSALTSGDTLPQSQRPSNLSQSPGNWNNNRMLPSWVVGTLQQEPPAHISQEWLKKPYQELSMSREEVGQRIAMSCGRDTGLCWGGGTGAQQLNGPGVRAHHGVSRITSRAELVMEMWRCSFPFIMVLSCEAALFVQ